MSKTINLIVLAVMSCVLLTYVAEAAEIKVTPADGDTLDYFGYSVAVDGNYAIVGAYGDDDNGNSSGAAYIFYRDVSGWSQQAKLLPGDGDALDYFGYSVSISGDYAIVGAYKDDDNGEYSGAAYIFSRSGSVWSQAAKLIPADGHAYQYFGHSVAITDNYAIIGAHGDDDNGDNAGAAYVFKLVGTSWLQHAKLVADDGDASDEFGWSVSIEGDYACIGAHYDDYNGSYSGSAYIFDVTGGSWVQQDKVLPNDGSVGDNFGHSVCIYGDNVIVGAHFDDVIGSNSGSAYIFSEQNGDWTQNAKLSPGDGTTNDRFGVSVSMSSDYAIIGAQHEDEGGTDAGAAYIFGRSNNDWIEQSKLIAEDSGASDWFGTSVYMSTDFAIVGAHYDDDFGENSGAVYIYDDFPSIPVEVTFQATLSVSDENDNSIDLVFGLDSLATSGFDPDYDQYAPPEPPTGYFDARFLGPDQGLIKDIRNSNAVSTTWEINYVYSENGAPATIQWDNTILPNTAYYRLMDNLTGGSIIDMDMQLTGEFVDLWNYGLMNLVHYPTIHFMKEVDSDWNLISLPSDVLYYYSVDELFPDAIPNTLYSFDAGYVPENELVIGKGYWIRFESSTVSVIKGVSTEYLAINVNAGWNMIGGISCDIPLSAVSTVPNGIIVPNTLYEYDNAYVNSTTIEQGKGYCIKTSSAGQIILDCNARGTSNELLAEDLDDKLNTELKISDATGACQTLYFNSELENPSHKEYYSLPAVPPSGAFDARFAGDYKLCDADSAEIFVQSSHYPLTISLENSEIESGYRYSLVEYQEYMELERHFIEDGMSIQITNPETNRLKIRKISDDSEILVPANFIVEQNYPNPFNPTTTIQYHLPQKTSVDIVVYNVVGNRVKTLLSEEKDAGSYRVVWNGTNERDESVESGIYFLSVTAGSHHKEIKKMILLK